MPLLSTQDLQFIITMVTIIGGFLLLRHDIKRLHATLDKMTDELNDKPYDDLNDEIVQMVDEFNVMLDKLARD